MFLNRWQVGFYNQLQHYNLSGFISSLLEFTSMALIYVIASGYQAYFKMLLTIKWRKWLTHKYISMWLKNYTYYKLNLISYSINPDQHISEDVNLFITNTVDLAVGLLRHIITLLVFSAVLWHLSGIIKISFANHTIPIPGYLFWLASLYSILGTWLIVQIGKPVIKQNVIQQSNEADFRNYLNRIKEHDECIALCGGETIEQITLSKYFQEIFNNYRRIINYTKIVTFLSSSYSQLSTLFAFLIASPRYFNNELELGQLFEISGAYWFVHSALSYIIDSFGKIALWKAVANRLDNLNLNMTNAIAENSEQSIAIHANSKTLKLADLTVFSPSRQTLLQNMSIEMRPRDRLLISGPPGSGKTTLLRTIAGIWPYFSGSIIKPKAHLMFIPQKPYAPVSSLKNILLYPHGDTKISDEKIHEILIKCNLPALVGQLYRIDDWRKVLSMGEMQCISFVRAIVQRPDWIFLDEATSSLDQKTEQNLYLLLTQSLPSLALISVGRQDRLHAYHTKHLKLDGLGAWYISTKN